MKVLHFMPQLYMRRDVESLYIVDECSLTAEKGSKSLFCILKNYVLCDVTRQVLIS